MIRFKKIIAETIPLVVSFFCSCSDNEILSPFDIQDINSVLASSALTSENIEIAANVIDGMPDTLYSKGKDVQVQVSGKIDSVDNRLIYAKVFFVRDTSATSPKGTITIDYGTSLGTADAMGVSRSGKIVINYYGKKWTTASYFSLHYDRLIRGNVQISGVDSLVLTSTSSSRVQMNSYFSKGTIIFPDGRTLTMEDTLMTRTRVWYRESIRANDQWRVTGGATKVTSKNGNSYTATITSPLISMFSCRASKIFVPIGGKEDINYSGKTYQIDYGNSTTCDNQINVTVGNTVKTVNVHLDGN